MKNIHTFITNHYNPFIKTFNDTWYTRSHQIYDISLMLLIFFKTLTTSSFINNCNLKTQTQMFMLTWYIKSMHLQHLLYFVLTRLYLKWTHPPIIASEISNAPPIELPKISPLYKEALFWPVNGFIIVKEITWISINMEIKININI